MVKGITEDYAELEAWSEQYLSQKWADRGMPEEVHSSYLWACENYCESPIERRLLAGLIFCPFGYYSDLNQVIEQEAVVAQGFAGDGAIIIPQAKLNKTNYRVDFLIVLNPRYLINKVPCPTFVLECDGHDFHERTKEQAARDRKRDRDIQNLGIPILRFTGSEIHRGLDECIAQIDVFGARLLEKLWGLKIDGS